MNTVKTAERLNLIDDKILMPNPRQIEWYNREKIAFIHFGINTFMGKEWGDGTESPELFNPTDIDVDGWIRVVKDAGFKCAILTAKHHDGFCLWPTKYTDHSIKNSPYKNGNGDIVKEFTTACARYGVKAGVYLSPWDRHEKTWGSDDYNDFYVGQLTELLSNYGKIWEVWWDGAGSDKAVYDWGRWANTVKRLAPDATIFGALGAAPYVDVRWVGNEKGFAGRPCYATIDERSVFVENTSELNSGKIDGDSFIPAEVDVSIRPGWFYHEEQDSDVRTPQNLMKLWFASNGSNAGFLLNLPPDKRGRIHENDENSIIEFAKNLEDAFSENLLSSAKITAKTTHDQTSVQNLLIDGDSFYAPSKDSEIALEIQLEKQIEFNTFVIREAIELGHRIKNFELFAYKDGEVESVCKGDCVGYRFAEHFTTIKTDKLLFKTSDSLSTPVLKFMGAYNLKDEYLYENVSIAKSKSVLDGTSTIEKKENGLDVNFGGVKPFNNIKVNGVNAGNYTLYVFNGSSFELVKQGTCSGQTLELSLDVIDYAYRIFIEASLKSDCSIEITYQK